MGGRGTKSEPQSRQSILTLLAEAIERGARKSKACEIIGISLRTIQRWNKAPQQIDGRKGAPKRVANKLSEAERKKVLETANLPAFASLPPSQIVPILADEGEYICSESTFYRVLHEDNQQHHRGKARAPTARACPRLIACKPNQVYSWDITYLPTAIKGQFYYLYLFIDIYSRFIVGWHIDVCQDNKIAAKAFSDICKKQGISAGQLTLHADNGGPMKGSTLLATFQQLGVIKSYSRPATSNDNPFSEALFKTIKYCPKYPRKPFEVLEQAKAWMASFVEWYNYEHRHSGIAFVTPYQRHTGEAEEILQKRMQVYQDAKNRNPERWSGKTRNWEISETVSINPIQLAA